MPSSRQLRAIGLVAFLTILILYYVTNGERLTHGSEFYRKTVTAIEHKKDAAARQHIIEEERQRQERVERLQKEHEAAMASATAPVGGTHTKEAAAGPLPNDQEPIVDNTGGEKSVAGRKKMKDGKIVDAKPSTDSDDGVAKVGNVAPKSSNAANGEEDEEAERQQKVEAELNTILKKGPIIIFSKSYCPYSKRAKHILLENYTISPEPYVVELDHHELGSGLQDALLKSTGRRTVPNILINGKSIGGGDDIQALHDSGKIIETVQAMGGKRIVSIQATPSDNSPASGHRAEVKFKA